MTQLIEYSMGIVFDGDDICLIEKIQPSWMEGLLNGLGGRLEDNETPIDCMVREFLKETGLLIPTYMWRHKLILKFAECNVYCFCSDYLALKSSVKSQMDEEVFVINYKSALNSGMLVPGLSWIIPLMRDPAVAPEAHEITMLKPS